MNVQIYMHVQLKYADTVDSGTLPVTLRVKGEIFA
jgi:hypothetical protein